MVIKAGDAPVPPASATTESAGIATTQRRAVAAKWWAWIGAGWMTVMVYMWTRWALSGHHYTDPGPDQEPGWMAASVWFWEISFTALTIWVAYHFVYKPIRQTGQLSFDGACAIAWVTLWMVQDVMIDFTRVWYTYNANLHNIGCPQCYFPGWLSPLPKTNAEAPLFLPGVYLTGFLQIILVCFLLRKAKARWPRLGTIGLVGMAFIGLVVADGLAEVLWLRSGMYIFGGAEHDVTLFQGHYYQLPIYEIIVYPVSLTVMACMRYFRNDRGQSFAERGLEKIRVGQGRKNWIKMLAVIGALQSILMVFYSIPMQYFALRSEAWPQDVLSRSYMTNGICGPGQKYACTDANIPAPLHPASGYVAPDGQYVQGAAPINQTAPAAASPAGS